MSAFALLIPPETFTGYLQRLTERSPTQQGVMENNKFLLFLAAAASVYDLAPLYLPRRLT
jgi:hypothetical protein